ncbi:hypothetical protein ACB098_02G030300 [Castanea mollissima]
MDSWFSDKKRKEEEEAEEGPAVVVVPHVCFLFPGKTKTKLQNKYTNYLFLFSFFFFFFWVLFFVCCVVFVWFKLHNSKLFFFFRIGTRVNTAAGKKMVQMCVSHSLFYALTLWQLANCPCLVFQFELWNKTDFDRLWLNRVGVKIGLF